MTVEIGGIVDITSVPKKHVIKEKGSYHEDVMAVIAEMAQVKDGEALDTEWENEKIATVRAATLRKAFNPETDEGYGFEVIVRGTHAYVSNPKS